MLKIKPVFFSIFVAVFISFFLAFSIFAILYFYWGDATAVKDGLSTVASFFGGFATLGAAVVAAFLFNDWREQHTKQVLAYEAKDTFQLYHNERDYIHKLKYLCRDIINHKVIKKYSWSTLSTGYEKEFLDQYNINKDKMSSFCFLSRGQLIYDLTNGYSDEVKNFTKFLSEKVSKQYSHTTFLDIELAQELLNKLNELECKNTKILVELKSYIFILK